MFETVAIPVWAMILIALFAGLYPILSYLKATLEDE